MARFPEDAGFSNAALSQSDGSLGFRRQRAAPRPQPSEPPNAAGLRHFREPSTATAPQPHPCPPVGSRASPRSRNACVTPARPTPQTSLGCTRHGRRPSHRRRQRRNRPPVSRPASPSAAPASRPHRRRPKCWSGLAALLRDGASRRLSRAWPLSLRWVPCRSHMRCHEHAVSACTLSTGCVLPYASRGPPRCLLPFGWQARRWRKLRR